MQASAKGTKRQVGRKIMTVKNPKLLPLFEDLKSMLEPLADQFTVRNAEAGRYELWSEVNIAPAGKPKHEPYFAGLIVQKNYVGLYSMPIYTDPDIRISLGADLLSTLHGQSCFYITNLTPTLREQLASALQLGLALYAAKGWVRNRQAETP
jgi:hypothetical protein